MFKIFAILLSVIASIKQKMPKTAPACICFVIPFLVVSLWVAVDGVALKLTDSSSW